MSVDDATNAQALLPRIIGVNRVVVVGPKILAQTGQLSGRVASCSDHQAVGGHGDAIEDHDSEYLPRVNDGECQG